MKKLTENLIQQRLKTCTTDLDKVVQINITGRELQDVSLLRKMTGIEILSLSVNRISSLIDFQFCKNLKELYLRNNNISDLKQIYYLSNLPKLKFLMLSQNPCADDPLYRFTVIKNLQSLIELDGIPITPEERQEAHVSGLTLKSEAFRFPENYNVDITQSRKMSVSSKHDTEHELEEVENEGTINEINSLASSKDNIELIKQPDNVEVFPKLVNAGDVYRGEDTKLVNPKNLKDIRVLNNTNKSSKALSCKFCKCRDVDSFLDAKIISRNTNILSATLNLIKELDYPSLQIVRAELISLLNAFEVEFVCQAQYD